MGRGGRWRLPRSFLKSGAKQMEVTAMHNHLRFRHGGSCWEQIKPLQTQLRISGVERNRGSEKSVWRRSWQNHELDTVALRRDRRNLRNPPLSSFVITSATRFLPRLVCLEDPGPRRRGPRRITDWSNLSGDLSDAIVPFVHMNCPHGSSLIN